MLCGSSVQDLSWKRSRQSFRRVPGAKAARAWGRQHAQQHAVAVQHQAAVSRGRQLCQEAGKRLVTGNSAPSPAVVFMAGTRLEQKVFRKRKWYPGQAVVPRR